MTKQDIKKQSWITEFEEKFIIPESHLGKKIKQFISKTVEEARREEREKIEKGIDDLIYIDGTPEYNQGLLDAIKILKN